MKIQINKTLDMLGSTTPAIAKVLSLHPETKYLPDQRIGFRIAEGLHIIKIMEILRCKAEGNYTEIHMLTGKKITISKTLKKVESVLGNRGFLRVHQSHLVAIDRIKFISSNSLTLNEGTVIPLSRGMKNSILNKLEKTMSII